MALQKYFPVSNPRPLSVRSLNFSGQMCGKTLCKEASTRLSVENDVDIDLREVYFLIMHFLSAGPCQRTCGQLWNELLEHNLLPRRYHSWYSRSGAPSGDEHDDGLSFPLSYSKLVERYPHVGTNHLVKLLKQLILSIAHPSTGGIAPNAADVPTLLGAVDEDKGSEEVKPPPAYMRWPHIQADQIRGLRLREIGGGFTRHHRAPSSRAACYSIAKPSTMVQKMQNIKRTRGHRNAVYCATFDRSGRFVITGSDDRLVKIWSMETAYCLASCRGHEGDITDLAVNSNNTMVASSSNDFIIRVWRVPDGLPVSVLRGHTGGVTAIAFSPRTSAAYQLLSVADDGVCRLWDARYSQMKPKIFLPRPPDNSAGKSSASSSSATQESHQIFCCAFNASGTVFVTGSSDFLARVWNACKFNTDDPEQPNHEMDVLSGHENDVNYVQFSGCAVASRVLLPDTKEDSIPKFKNNWFSHDSIVTCSRDGSAIIWVPRSRKSHGKSGRWTRAYHLKVPPPPMPPQPLRGGPRQRVLPTPRGVNMIVWSLDNRFVLAAIMDCRICVWNAADGSLVHSLTGHTESTYVLDVHPFNPRVAMSAGYDGKIIVWDIWEGKPIRIYETGPYKLVDGKFSPDGTSIVVSDDVGQLYILCTGQGESQKDAKYDQFFLGDYRPLIQDANGHVVDQDSLFPAFEIFLSSTSPDSSTSPNSFFGFTEKPSWFSEQGCICPNAQFLRGRETQLVPYRRNLQDLLCDSGMIPYEEPYQSIYQRRRLGTLGIDWRPSSVRFAIGPDFNSDQDYQVPPLVDLNMMIDPLPEFTDVMDWEPDVEIQSDDSDSEYNVAEEFSFGGDEISLATSGDSDCSAEDSENGNIDKECIRRSKRKKHRLDIEITTSSGRRVKRRNLDEYGENLRVTSQTRKIKNGRKASRKKNSSSSSSKSLRPRRAAARNALSLFSKINGTSPDAEDDGNGTLDDSSESGSGFQDSDFESGESDKYVLDDHLKLLKGKEVLLDGYEESNSPHDLLPAGSSGSRKRLVLKLPVRYQNKNLFTDDLMLKNQKTPDLGPYGVSHVPIEANGDTSRLQVKEDREMILDGHRRAERDEVAATVGTLDFSGGHKDVIKWGGVRARTPKRPRLSSTTALNTDRRSVAFRGENSVRGSNGSLLPERLNTPVCQNDINEFNSTSQLSDDQGLPGISGVAVGSKEFGDFNGMTEKVLPDKDNSGGLVAVVPGNTGMEKVRIRSSGSLTDPCCSSILKMNDDIQDTEICESPSCLEPNTKAGKLPRPCNEGVARNIESSDGVTNEKASSSSQDSQCLLPLKRDRMYSAVYRRSKGSKTRVFSGANEGGNELASSASNAISNEISKTHGVGADGPVGFSAGLVDTDQTPNGMKSVRAAAGFANGSLKRCDKVPSKEWASGMTVGLRSTRNRRSTYARDLSHVDRKKLNQSPKKVSWLMLSMHEGSRYIPQQGDEVVYLRQGHQEYISGVRSPERGPWQYLKGEINSVEYCKVVELEYSTLPGSGDSCCKMTLEFVDPGSKVSGKTFRLTLPEVTSFPDFLVEKTRYDAAVQRNWTARDKCQVWWKNEGEEDGSWWEGRIVGVKAKSVEFPDSPWERYAIRYKSDPGETHYHSPWELYDSETGWRQPHIDDKTRDKLLLALDKLEQSGNKPQDNFGVQKLKQVVEKSSFLNRFPVPLSLEVIRSRLENNYYRSLEAVKHDVEVVLLNAESYFGKSAENSVKVKRLSEWFERLLSSF